MPKSSTLIVIHRIGPEHESDFGRICAKVKALDPESLPIPQDLPFRPGMKLTSSDSVIEPEISSKRARG